jgi:hypothetical protein
MHTITLEKGLATFLNALSGKNRSSATIRAYQTDISQFISLVLIHYYFDQQFFTPYPDSHHDTLRLHGALVQGEVSFSRCISSYCTTGWRLPPLLSLSIIVTFIDMNNRAARPLMLHAARPLTLCINGVYISAALERIDTTT